MVTPENINPLLAEHGCTGEVDVMSIDIDSLDYWLLDALEVSSPRILIMEYNARFGPVRAVTLPVDLPLTRPKGYFGASLMALTQKANEKGYRLVVCESAGVNAFFVRRDVAPDIPEVAVAAAFRAAVSADDPDAGGEDRQDIFAIIEAQNLPLVDV